MGVRTRRQLEPVVSYLLRRSGISVCSIAHLLGWHAEWIYQVGVGTLHEETVVMRETWPGVQMIGFEPCQRSYRQRLMGEVELGRQYKQVGDRHYDSKFPGQLYNLAISDYDGVGQLSVPHKHRDAATLHKLLDEDRVQYTETVQVKRLDSVFPDGPESGHILLWLDCEGSELAVLRGGEEFVKKVEMINIELTSNPTIHDNPHPLEIHRWLSDHGFFRQWVHTQRSHVGQVDVIYVRQHLFAPEICCCPCAVEQYDQCCK